MGEQLIGTVTHYFGQPHVAILDVTAGELRVGDTIRVAGAHSDFTQQVGQWSSITSPSMRRGSVTASAFRYPSAHGNTTSFSS